MGGLDVGQPLGAGSRLGWDAARAGRLAEAVEEGLGGEMAGDFASGGSAYAVADDEGAVLGQGGAGVLVDVADAAAMGAHGEGQGVEVGGGDRGGGGVDLRLGRLQSCGVRHFGTRDRRNWGSLETILLVVRESIGFALAERSGRDSLESERGEWIEPDRAWRQPGGVRGWPRGRRR